MDCKLVMFREDGSKRVFPLNEGRTAIGRKDDCDIRIPLAMVSRRHAEIIVEEDGAAIKNLGASNGTFLNNRRIEDEEDLEPGDQIVIGPVVFTVQIDGEPSDEDLVEVRTKVHTTAKGSARGPGVTTSKHVYTSEEEVDPISALEALASSADQTAINPEEED
jgi:pSer/pThr/pTyr-binding forkhead associated (FHA) protein